MIDINSKDILKKLMVDEIWYVKFRGVPYLTKIKILELTDLTVKLKECNREYSTPSRYKISDIDFVEKEI